jgi:hypothetical protein
VSSGHFLDFVDSAKSKRIISIFCVSSAVFFFAVFFKCFGGEPQFLNLSSWLELSLRGSA